MIFKILFLLICVSFQMNLWLLHIGMSSCDFLKNNLIYFFLAVLGLHCYTGFSLLCGKWVLFSIMVASLVAEHGLEGTWASVVVVCGLSSCGTGALEHRLHSCGAGLSRSVTCGIFPEQGSCPWLLHWPADSTTEPPQDPPVLVLFLLLLPSPHPNVFLCLLVSCHKTLSLRILSRAPPPYFILVS